MGDESDFYREVQHKIGFNKIYLNHGMNIYYSDVEDDELMVQVGNFLFKK